MSTPTTRWLAAAPMLTPLPDHWGTAERLLLLIHYGIDWREGWVTRHRATYWVRLLPDRVIALTYRTASLRSWWQDLCADLDSQPRNTAERHEAALLLEADPTPVLLTFRTEAEALILRTRIVADAVRAARVITEEA